MGSAALPFLRYHRPNNVMAADLHNIVIATLGSYGDTHPFIGIARELRDRGHNVTLIAPAVYQPLADLVGLNFAPIGSKEQFERLAANPDIFVPRRAFAAVADAAGQLIELYYRAIVKRHEPGRTILVYSTLVMAGRIAQEKLGIPAAAVHLSPSVFRSVIDPPYMPELPARAGWPVWWNRFWWWAADVLAIDRLCAPPINRFRASLGLAPVRGILRDWIHSPDRVIGLFPDWFGKPAPDWPKQTRLTGFPLYDEADVTPMEEGLLRFLDGGSPPIAFTPGSAMQHGQDFFAAAIETCQTVGRRGLLLSRHTDHLPEKLPPEVMHVSFAPFGKLLPRCAALVHHGGIGTCGQALAAGVPQLVTPMAHDQPDNARRLQRLGVAEVLPFAKLTPPGAAAAIDRLLHLPQISAACANIARKFDGQRPVALTADLIEQLAPGAANRIIPAA
jgi:rhamnosyltransferase subunit B